MSWFHFDVMVSCIFCGETKEENFSWTQRRKGRPGCKKCIKIHKPQTKSKKNRLKKNILKKIKSSKALTNEKYLCLLLTGYIRTVIKFDNMYSKIPMDIITFCGTFFYDLSQK
eukprot:105940_1